MTTKLVKGDLAPNFITVDYRGNSISLSDYRGKTILLAFHAFGSCPFCNLRVKTLSNQYKNWQAANFEMIHVFPSSPEVIGKFAGQNNPDFPVVSDKNKALFARYGVSKSFIGMMKGFMNLQKLGRAFSEVNMYQSMKNNDAALHQLPAEFLIDEKGVIITAHYAKNTSDNLSIEIIESYLRSKMKIAA